MRFSRSALSWLPRALAAAVLSCVLPAAAQIWGPLTLDELKAETQRRADRNLPPIAGIKPEDARAAIAQLHDLERETWAAAWIANGERYMKVAKAHEGASPQQAERVREAYYQAWHNFSTGRWPSEKLSPGKQKAYERALDAFQAYGKLLDPPIQTVQFPFEGKQVTAYLRLPKSAKPVPLVFGINGLDSRKEDVIARVDEDRKSTRLNSSHT